MTQPCLVKRSDLPTVREVVVHGKTHYLGVLKEFIKDERMRTFLPKDLPISMAWVRLDKDEVLAVHTHPVDSMILICEGRGLSIGELECPIEEGDAVLVPSGHAHGFVGAGPQGFWGLSLQFETRGLYEDLLDPWASFQDHELHNLEVLECNSLRSLLLRNVELKERFAKARIFTAAQRGGLEDAAARARLLDCLGVWCRYLGQVPHAGHSALDVFDDLVSMIRGNGKVREIRDPSLEALCAWFLWRGASATQAERMVLTGLVLKPAVSVVLRGLAPYLDLGQSAPASLTESDDNRVASLLESERVADWARLATIQREGWEAATAMLGRVATLVLR